MKRMCRCRSVFTRVVPAVLALAVAACATAPSGQPHVHDLPKTVTFAGEPVPVDDPEVYERVSTWYNLYLSQPWHASRWLERAEQVFPIVEPILEEHDLPEDLKYVAVLESSLDPRAIGEAGERGIWQFMPDTAEEFDLTMNRFVDERSDIAASTQAAAEYFRESREEISGSWNLAVASFNVGVDGVTARTARQGENDYWSMVFPPVTEDYLPKAIAAKLLMENASAFDIGPQVSHPEIRAFSVTLEETPLYLVDIAERIDVRFRQLWRANPHIWKPYLEPGEYTIYLPEDAAGDMSGEALETFLRDQPYEKRSLSADGERTIAEIADERGVTADELATFNDVSSGYTPEDDEEIVYWHRGE